MRSVFSQWLREQSLPTKFAIVAAADFIMLVAAVLLSYALRVSSFDLPPQGTLHLYLIAPFLSVLLAFLFGVYGASARYFTVSLERGIVLSQLLVPAVWAIILLGLGTFGFARSTLIIYLILSIAGMILLRRTASYFMSTEKRPRMAERALTPVIIYGAGAEGLAVLDAVRRQGKYKPLAFLDTDYTLVDRVVAGLKVYSTENLDHVITRFAPQEAIIAKPTQSRANKKQLVDMLMGQGLAVKTVPGVDEIVDGKFNLSDLRHVHVEDLLGRDPVPPDISLMEKAVKNQVVMVTGAGGSIGSELLRQAFDYGPKTLVLVEHSEFALFEIHRELEKQAQSLGSPITLVPILADVRDKPRMLSMMKQHSVDIVFHAAAYKHVRMVQENAPVGIDNNVFGTKAVAEAAMESGVKRFILISTDKAVRPTSVMGASKRVAEMIVQALAAEKNHKTIFSMVRFGNVLGSTGSVVPLFREQIAKGGPITVTHPEVTRYFMLIPEAAQLVIQAGAMAVGGEVFVLDMGEPIKIVQLAETMIELAGMTRKSEDTPDGDIEIQFVGLKDGEKLYEELQIGKDITSTSHPRIVCSNEMFLPGKQLSKELVRLCSGEKFQDQKRSQEHLLYIARLD